MKKVFFVITIAMMMVVLCARQGCQAPQFTTPETTAPSTEIVDASIPETETTAPAEDTAMLKAYQRALQQISFEHIYPDGTDIGFDGGFGFIEDNHFAIFDVDGDGIDELIVSITTAPMAGQAEIVYQYDPATDSLKIQLQAFPALTYYTNGIIRADWSHNHTLSMQQWPFDLYDYDALLDSYTSNTSVYAWDKDIAETDENGNPYPQNADRDNVGTVFHITQDCIGNWVSKSDYESWLSGVLGTAEELEIPYQSMTEENIKKVAE